MTNKKMVDFQTKNGRLNKRKEKRSWLEIIEKVATVAVVLYFIYFLYQALVYIFSNVTIY